MRALIVGFAVFAVAAMAGSARAAVTATATEVGGDVVFAASGTLNLDAWTFDQTIDDFSRINPSDAIVLVGPTPAVQVDLYGSPVNMVAPDDFGTGGNANAVSGTGQLIGFRSAGGGLLTVPNGYASGVPLDGSATFAFASFASLGMEVGTYTWTWGQDATADSFTLEVVETPPQTALLVTARETGGDVVFQASGALNIDDWTFDQTTSDASRINPSTPIVVLGEAASNQVDVYGTPPPSYEGPDSFGMGGDGTPTSGSGATFGFGAISSLVVPAGYASGEGLSATTTYAGETYASLGMEIGTYVWSWGVGATSTSFTLVVIDPTPTEESSWGQIKMLGR